MKFIISILLTAFLGYIIPMFSYMPWWSFAITSFLVAIAIHQQGFKAFISAFVAMFLVWAAYAFLLDLKNDHILSARISALLGIGGTGIELVLIAGLIAGLISGLASLTGSYLRTLKRL